MYLDLAHVLSINTLENLEGYRWNPDMNLNFDTRWYQNIATENENVFGCSVPWHPKYRSNVTGDEIKICQSAEKARKARKRYGTLWAAKLSHEWIPCATFETSPGLPDIDDTDNNQEEAFIRLYVKRKIKIKSIIMHYDSTTLTAEIGGYIGMFLGVSIVDLGILLNAFLLNLAHEWSFISGRER